MIFYPNRKKRKLCSFFRKLLPRCEFACANFSCDNVQGVLYWMICVQAALIISGLFICGFANFRSKYWVLRRTSILIPAFYRSYYSWSKFERKYLPRITRETCTYFMRIYIYRLRACFPCFIAFWNHFSLVVQNKISIFKIKRKLENKSFNGMWQLAFNMGEQKTQIQTVSALYDWLQEYWHIFKPLIWVWGYHYFIKNYAFWYVTEIHTFLKLQY